MISSRTPLIDDDGDGVSSVTNKFLPVSCNMLNYIAQLSTINLKLAGNPRMHRRHHKKIKNFEN
jgi:sterol desaturase/sphingolipid hydroxylase (fatty acid hydroxylase superfamily)